MSETALPSFRARHPLLDQLLIIDRAAFVPKKALRTAIAICTALSFGMIAFSPVSGIAIAAGAFNAGTAELARGPHGPIRTMASAAAALAACAGLGSLTADHFVLRLVLAALIAIFATLLTESGIAPPPVAAQALVGFVLLGRLPLNLHDSVALAGEILLGAAISIVFQLLFPIEAHGETGWSLSGTFRWMPGASIQVARASFYRLLDTSTDSWWWALRSALAVVLALLLAKAFDGERGYWIPLTSILVLKSDWTATSRLAVARSVGTLLGVVPATFVLANVHPHGVGLVLMIGIVAWIAMAVLRVNYALFAIVLTVYVVLSLDVVFPTPSSAALDRLLDTVIGGALAMAIAAAGRPWRMTGSS